MIYNPYLRALIMCAQRSDWKFVEKGWGTSPIQAGTNSRLLSSALLRALSLCVLTSQLISIANGGKPFKTHEKLSRKTWTGMACPGPARPGRRPKGANIEHILVWHAIITESRRDCESHAKCVSKFKHWKRERKTDNCLQPGLSSGV